MICVSASISTNLFLFWLIRSRGRKAGNAVHRIGIRHYDGSVLLPHLSENSLIFNLWKKGYPLIFSQGLLDLSPEGLE